VNKLISSLNKSNQHSDSGPVYSSIQPDKLGIIRYSGLFPSASVVHTSAEYLHWLLAFGDEMKSTNEKG